MATYLASINIDQYELSTQKGPEGISIRNYFPTGLPLSNRSQLLALPKMIDFFDDLFGPYAFEEYGVVIAAKDGLCADVQIALEAQTMTIHCPGAVMTSEEVVVHELAHMWFGDSVSLENWKDIWLKEGPATYASWLWHSKNDPAALKRTAIYNENHFLDTEYSVAEPSPDNLYTGESYTGGALVLYALDLGKNYPFTESPVRPRADRTFGEGIVFPSNGPDYTGFQPWVSSGNPARHVRGQSNELDVDSAKA